MIELISCPNCGMSNLVIIDTLLPRVSGVFTCTDCHKEFHITGETMIKEAEHEQDL